MFDRKLEGYIEQLHDGQSHNYVGRNFHSAARLADRLHYSRYIRGGLQKLISKLVKVVGGAAQFIQDARSIDQRRGCPFTIA